MVLAPLFTLRASDPTPKKVAQKALPRGPRPQR